MQALINLTHVALTCLLHTIKSFSYRGGGTVGGNLTTSPSPSPSSRVDAPCGADEATHPPLTFSPFHAIAAEIGALLGWSHTLSVFSASVSRTQPMNCPPADVPPPVTSLTSFPSLHPLVTTSCYLYIPSYRQIPRFLPLPWFRPLSCHQLLYLPDCGSPPLHTCQRNLPVSLQGHLRLSNEVLCLVVADLELLRINGPAHPSGLSVSLSLPLNTHARQLLRALLLEVLGPLHLFLDFCVPKPGESVYLHVPHLHQAAPST